MNTIASLSDYIHVAFWILVACVFAPSLGCTIQPGGSRVSGGSCDFSGGGTCGYTLNGAWKIRSGYYNYGGKTIITFTGAADGYYAVYDLGGGAVNHEKTLVSPTLSPGSYCLSFRYYKTDSSSVLTVHVQTSKAQQLIWNTTNGAVKSWSEHTVTVSTNEQFQIIFSSDKPAGWLNLNTVGLDDIIVSKVGAATSPAMATTITTNTKTTVTWPTKPNYVTPTTTRPASLTLLAKSNLTSIPTLITTNIRTLSQIPVIATTRAASKPHIMTLSAKPIIRSKSTSTKPTTMSSLTLVEATTITWRVKPNLTTTPTLTTTTTMTFPANLNITTTSSTSAFEKSKTPLDIINGIHAACENDRWNISVDLKIMKQFYPGVKESDIYLGSSSCKGVLDSDILRFQQSLQSCSSTQTRTNTSFNFKNKLMYAEHDPLFPLIIRRHVWDLTVECDVPRDTVVHTHVHHEGVHLPDTVITPPPDHSTVSLAFYSDSGFSHALSGPPLQIKVGDAVYVKAFNTKQDPDVKLILHSCYVEPFTGINETQQYFLIKNGCVTDPNTHIILYSLHEIRFVFQEIEFSANPEGLDIYCEASLCDIIDFTSRCSPTCTPEHLIG